MTTEEGNTLLIEYMVSLVAETDVEWEEDEYPSGYNYATDLIRYTSSIVPIMSDPEIKSVAFTQDSFFYINGEQELPVEEAKKVLGSTICKQLLNPDLYYNILYRGFEKEVENMEYND